MRCFERKNAHISMYRYGFGFGFVCQCQILDSHPGMAFAKWLASLDEEPFSFEVLFA